MGFIDNLAMALGIMAILAGALIIRWFIRTNFSSEEDQEQPK